MSVTAPFYERGKIAGLYPSLATRRDESYIQFVEDARNILLHAQQGPIGAYSRKLLQDAGASQKADPASTQQAADLLMHDPALKMYYRVKRSLQESFWKCIGDSFGSKREALIAAMDAAAMVGPGSVTTKPDMPIPDYATTQIHLQPGGYTGEALSGMYYDYGLKVFMGGAADNDKLPLVMARVMRPPADGKLARILDLGCSAGATTTSLKVVHPTAEVTGIDISAPMVRYAHLRAIEQNIAVDFKQMDAAKMDFPDNHFDAVLAMLLFHEVPVEISRAIIAETLRVLRPGGVLTLVDFSGDRDRDVYNMFFAVMDAADNGEPFLPGYVRSNVEDLLVAAGFELEAFNPANSLRTGRVATKPLKP